MADFRRPPKLTAVQLDTAPHTGCQALRLDFNNDYHIGVKIAPPFGKSEVYWALRAAANLVREMPDG